MAIIKQLIEISATTIYGVCDDKQLTLCLSILLKTMIIIYFYAVHIKYKLCGVQGA